MNTDALLRHLSFHHGIDPDDVVPGDAEVIHREEHTFSGRGMTEHEETRCDICARLLPDVQDMAQVLPEIVCVDCDQQAWWDALSEDQQAHYMQWHIDALEQL